MVQYSKAIEKIVERANKSGGAGAAGFVRQMQGVASATRALEGVMMNRNPVDTDAGHLKKVHQAGERLAKSLEATRSRGTDLLNSTMQELTGQLRSRSGIRPPENMAEVVQQSEIRQAMQRLSPKERSDVALAALKNGDALTINAIANGAPFLSGLEKERIDALVESHQRKTAPDVMEEFDAVLEADHSLQAAIRAAERAATDARDEVAMQRIMRAESAAGEADRAFGEALQG